MLIRHRRRIDVQLMQKGKEEGFWWKKISVSASCTLYFKIQVLTRHTGFLSSFNELSSLMHLSPSFIAVLLHSDKFTIDVLVRENVSAFRL